MTMSDNETSGKNGATGLENGFRFSPRSNRAGEINWRHWGDEAFEEAAAEGKLVLLSISAVWCHWCHVMDETTYSDSGVIERINRDYIPVRVDSDKRPEINRRYNQGGWPTTAFLVPSGRAVAGLTYSPPEQLTQLLDKLALVYRHRKSEIDTEAASAGAEERELLRSMTESSDIDPDTSAEVQAEILRSWDRGFGGLGDAPKFPPSGALEFALARYLETDDQALRSFVVSTLDGMSLGGLYDKADGGFFRYATARDWSSPHYEKMLSDNADLIFLYLAASTVLDRPDYAQIARGTLDYVIHSLLDDEGSGFYGSQDADEHYYHRDARGRASMDPPAVDRTIYVDTTSQMISALVFGASVLDDPDLLKIALRVSDFIWRQGFRHGTGMCHFINIPAGTPELWGQPADQVNFLRALIDLYQVSPAPSILERAIELGRAVVERYVGERGWIGEASERKSAGLRVLDDIPTDVPDILINGNGARALLALEELAPGHDFAEVARGVLESLAGKYIEHEYFSAGYALAVEMLEKGLIEVRVAPGDSAGERDRLTRAAAAAFNPRKLVRLETVEDYVPLDSETEGPPAVVCSAGDRCLPVYNTDELKEALASLASGA